MGRHVSLLGPGQPIELPRAGRSAAPFAVFAFAAALLLLVPGIPRAAAVAAALAFALAAALRATQQHRALVRLRSSVDRLLLRSEASPLSPILSWRAGELCTPDARDHLAKSLRRVDHAAEASHLPGVAPFNRVAIRACHSELDELISSLRGNEPVTARGMLLVRSLLDDPSGPLYDRDRSAELEGELRRALVALEGRAGQRHR
jgi:hypothetical protein